MVDTRYTYAVARIRALETHLLDRATLDRLLNEDAKGIIRLLKETEYDQAFREVDDPADFEYGLTNELDRVLLLLENVAADKHLVQLFRIRYDFHNLKVLLYTRYSEEPADEAIIPLGLTPVEELEKAIDHEPSEIPEYLKDAIENARDLYEKNQDIHQIGLLIERLMWGYLVKEAQNAGNPFLQTLFQKYVDLVNIRTLLRLKDEQQETEDLSSLIIPGGALSQKFFAELLTQPWDVFLRQLAAKQYQDIVSQALDSWPQERSFWKLELAADNHILKFIEKVKLSFFGIEPLVAYLIYKMTEINTIRSIIIGKLAGFSPEKLRSRLRIIYV